jgi:hypothetical protein
MSKNEYEVEIKVSFTIMANSFDEAENNAQAVVENELCELGACVTSNRDETRQVFKVKRGNNNE